jgi:hypothetical protein
VDTAQEVAQGAASAVKGASALLRFAAPLRVTAPLSVHLLKASGRGTPRKIDTPAARRTRNWLSFGKLATVDSIFRHSNRVTVANRSKVNDKQHMGNTLGTAAKATGMSRTAILRAIGKGKISAKKNEHGEWDIDPAELHRVYPPQQNSTVNDNINPSNTNSSEIREIKAKLEAAEQRILDKDGVIDDLRRRLDQSEQERRDKDRQLTALLTDQRAKAPDVIAMPPASPPMFHQPQSRPKHRQQHQPIPGSSTIRRAWW